MIKDNAKGYNELLGRSNTLINLDSTSIKVLNCFSTLLEGGPETSCHLIKEINFIHL